MAEKRSSFFLYINTTPKTGNGTYALVGDGVTELTINYNPQTTSSQYIHQNSATTTVTGYQVSAPVTSEVVKTDDAFNFINEMRRNLPLGSDAETDIVMVDLYDAVSSGSSPAIKQKVSIQIDSYGGSASDPLSIGYTINWVGDGVQGSFNTSTKTWSGGTVSLNDEMGV